MNQEANTQPFTSVGHIARPHGLTGELKIEFSDISPDLLEDLSIVYLRNDRGDFFPARISSFRKEEKGNTFSFFVQFEHIADRSAAEPLKGRPVFIETEVANQLFDSTTHQEPLLHFDVYDETDKHVGTVTEIITTPAQTVLGVSSGSGSLLIPVVDQYVIKVDESEESIICQNLQDLQDL